VNRAVALLLAVIGGGAIAFAALLIGVAAIGGILWIYVFGDNSWPAWVETASNVAIPVIGLMMWAGFGWFIWLRLTASRPAG
jgi:uncharacterized BrkB/YihY/UPF0761 family membrane protein